MLAQQSFNFLSKLAQRAMIGKDAAKLDSNLSYLNDLGKDSFPKCTASAPEHFLNLDILEEALRVNQLHKLKQVMKKMHDSNVSKKDFVNSVAAIDIVRVAEAHIRLVSFIIFKNKVLSGAIKCKNLKKILTNVCLLYGLWQLNQDPRSCYEAAYFTNSRSSEFVLEAMKFVCKELRPQMLNVIESFDFPEMLLSSAIGNYYGDIYETHLEWAKDSRLNKTPDAIPEGFMEYMMPVLKGKM